MLMTLALLTLVSRISHGVTTFRTCVPNTTFRVNDHFCSCDGMGRWTEASCEISRRHSCQTGQIIWDGCSQCICQESGRLICNKSLCRGDAIASPSQTNKSIDVATFWCTPFVSYYLNCSLCVCPASGKMSEARCAADANCPFRTATDYLAVVKYNVCIPKVMYLFPCFHCQCSAEGYFVVSKCKETCQTVTTNVTRRCKPKTFYRKGCNICFCPENGLLHEKLCTKDICSHEFTLSSLDSLRNKTRSCQHLRFTGRNCFYCECTHDSKLNDKACLESECISIDNFRYNYDGGACSPGQLIPKCMECLCLRDGFTNPSYCTKVCSYQQKLAILEVTIKESFSNHLIIDRDRIRTSKGDEPCEPNTLYQVQGKYCICPGNGETNYNICTAVVEEQVLEKKEVTIPNAVDIDFNVKCVPNTFVDFDCNSCYCFKTGRIDPKWCTYDDCEAKRIVSDRQKTDMNDATIASTGTCVAGSISHVECNFCICPESGRLMDRACTKNICFGVRSSSNTGFICVPLTFYSVDCNICYCPKSGFKNVAQCTKNNCEKNFLRSEVCVPGKLFSEDCRMCVCPPNGDKHDQVCTNNTCVDNGTPWRKIFQLSQNLLSNQKTGEATRNLELCFPGEEFEQGCKICLCPDMGLRMYATCTQMCSEDKNQTKKIPKKPKLFDAPVVTRRKSCTTFNLSINEMEHKQCTPGSMYIINCRECICPYMGNIKSFCRPLQESIHCEQAFPNINYASMGRRNLDNKANATKKPPSSDALDSQESSPHTHTAWACEKSGRIMDNCFICECENGVFIEEHCYRSPDKSCVDSEPTFLKEIILPEV